MITQPDPPSRSTSWTEINTFRTCPHKHKLQYIEQWRSPKVSKPLATGILWHEILEHHYNGVMATGDVGDPGKDALQAIADLLNLHGATDPQHPEHDISSTCLWMYHGYRRWAAQTDLGWKIVAVEVEFEVEIPDSLFKLIGRIDLVIEYKRHLWAVDHKATKNLPGQKELDLDDQTPLYMWALRRCGYNVLGAMLSHTRTQQLKRHMFPEERFQRDMIYRTLEEVEVVVQEALASINMAYAENQKHPRHPNPSTCKWSCPFVEPCIAGRRAEHLETELLVGLGFTRSEHPRLRIVT